MLETPALWETSVDLCKTWLVQSGCMKSSDGQSMTMNTGPGSAGVHSSSGRIWSTGNQEISSYYRTGCEELKNQLSHLFSFMCHSFSSFQSFDYGPDGCCSSTSEAEDRSDALNLVFVCYISQSQLSRSDSRHLHRQAHLFSFQCHEVPFLRVQLRKHEIENMLLSTIWS